MWEREHMDRVADGEPPAGGGDGTDGSSEETGPNDGAEDSALRETFADFARGVPTPVVVFDADGRIVRANEAVETRFEYGSAVCGQLVERIWPTVRVDELQDLADVGGIGSDSDHGVWMDRDGNSLTFDVDTVTVDGRTAYAAVIHDVTGHVAAERRREQFERIVQTIDDGVYVLDDTFDITMVNDAVEAMTGYDREELVGANASKLASEETLRKAAAVSDSLIESDSSAATITTEIERADGTVLPIETRFSVYQFADGSWGQVGVLRDISNRVRYQETLTALHDSTRELLHVESRDAVAEQIVETARDVLDVSMAAMYLYDAESNRLRPAATANVGDTTTDHSPVAPDDGPLWTAFGDGERLTDRSGEPIELTPRTTVPATNATFIPLDEYGVFVVAMTDEDWAGAGTAELVDLLVASAESGLQRVAREEQLRVRDRERRERNERLRQLKRTNEIIRRIDGAMVDADSRTEIEAAVCEELVESGAFAAAWVGRVEDGDLTPYAWAGDATGYLDDVDLSLSTGDEPPSVRSARSGEVVTVSSVATDLRNETWRMAAVRRGFGSVISVPLPAEEGLYGVLTVFGTDPSTFDESMQSVFAELGETIGNAFRAVETREWLAADSVIDVGLEVTAPDDPLSRLAAGTNANLTVEGTVTRGDERWAFVRGDGDDPAVESVADGITGIESVRSLGDVGVDLFEVVLTAPTVAGTVVDCGGRLTALTVTGSTATLEAELPTTASVREFVDALARAHGDAELRSRRTRTDPTHGTDGLRAALADRLTERQRDVLRAAYFSGYFEWPRTTTGQEVADSFDVSQPTVNRHLRVALRKHLQLLYGD